MQKNTPQQVQVYLMFVQSGRKKHHSIASPADPELSLNLE